MSSYWYDHRKYNCLRGIVKSAIRFIICFLNLRQDSAYLHKENTLQEQDATKLLLQKQQSQQLFGDVCTL